MATVTLRMDDSVRDRLQEMADARGASVSDLIRSAIDGLFDRDDRDELRPAVVPESLGAVDRKQLALLHRILARLVEDRGADDRLGEDGDTSYQLDRAQALEAGWAREYDMEFYAMEAELSRRDCGLVMDIFDMFRVLKYSADEAGDQLTDDEASWLKFRGYDLNDRFESRLLEYARWIVSDGDRWQEQADVFSDRHDRGNSHMPMLSLYKRLLETYEPIWRGVVHRGGRHRSLLTADELKQIAAAAIHPSHRKGR